jgi:hypothetical protein
VASICESHARIHAAEGALFRAALAGASRALGVPVVEVRARDLAARAAALLGVSVEELADRLAALGRDAGPPWGKDQKEALLAALVAAS